MKTVSFRRIARRVALLVFAMTLAGCGSDPLRPPTITSLNPSSAIAGGPSFTLRVIGTGFQSTDVVLWNGAALATQPVSSTELDGQVPGTLIQSAIVLKSAVQPINGALLGPQSVSGQSAGDATVAVNVFRKPPDTMQSNTATFTINPAGPTGGPTGAPALSVTKTHTGNFTQGQTGIFTITAGNSGSASTSGTVTVSDTPPVGLTPSAASGSGWSCTVSGTTSCTRSDALAGGSSYPAITLTVAVAADAPSSITNTVTVSGGGAANPATAGDPTNINPAPPAAAALVISKSHSGNFAQGQLGATYTISVSNNGGAGPTSGTVTVTDTLPSSLTQTALSGTGWTCNNGTLTCTRSDALPVGSSYPQITLTVNVSSSAPASVTNAATVSGGGSPSNTANDPTNITAAAAPALSIAKTHMGNFTKNQNGTYTINVGNTGSGPSSGNVSLSDFLPSSMTQISISGTGWSCDLVSVSCTRGDALPAGGSYPPITLTVAVSPSAPSSVTNTVQVCGGGSPCATTNDPTTIM